MILLNDNGVVSLRSRHSVSDAITALERAVRKAGLEVMARIDHGAFAAKAGIAMAPTQLLIFGNAASGSLLMVATPTAAIDLPLKGLACRTEKAPFGSRTTIPFTSRKGMRFHLNS